MLRVTIAEILWAREDALCRQLAALRDDLFRLGLDKRGSLIADEAPGSHRKHDPHRWERLSKKPQPVAIFPPASVADGNIGYR